MTSSADTLPLFAWDGGRGLAFGAPWDAAGTEFALFAHGQGAPALVAVWEASAGVCLAQLPQGTQHAELHVLRAGQPGGIVAIELDDMLLPDLVAPDLEGRRLVRVATGGSGISLVPSPAANAGLHCLTLQTDGFEGFHRCRVGPLFDPAEDGRCVTIVPLDGMVGELVFSASGVAAGRLLMAHVFGARGRSTPELLQGEDASGATSEVIARRGFRYYRADSKVRGAAMLLMSHYAEGDRAILLAPRGYQVTWAGGGDSRLGSRLIVEGPPGELVARPVATAYRPATSTAVAALSGGAIGDGGAAADVEGTVADLAAAIWQRDGAPEVRRPLPAPAHDPAFLPPLARLTVAAAQIDRGDISPVTAALGAAFRLGEAVMEEIDALPSQERLALVLWFARDPALAGRAVRARVSLPFPDGAPDGEKIAAALEWFSDAGTPARLAAAVSQLAGRAASADERDAVRALRVAAESIGIHWLGLDAVLAAFAALPAEAQDDEPDVDAPVLETLESLKSDAVAVEAAKSEAGQLDQETLAAQRAELEELSQEAGQGENFRTELAEKLPELAPDDVVLLHRRFTGVVDRQRMIAAVREATVALDAAAGNEGLAARMDRSGDPLLGMTRLGSTCEGVVRDLTRTPALKPALVTLTDWMGERVPPADEGDATMVQLRRNLQSYACLLLMQAVAAECAAAIPPPSDETSGRDARLRRLQGGLGETLPQYVLAVSAFLPEGVELGSSLTGRLAGAAS